MKKMATSIYLSIGQISLLVSFEQFCSNVLTMSPGDDSRNFNVSNFPGSSSAKSKTQIRKEPEIYVVAFLRDRRLP